MCSHVPGCFPPTSSGGRRYAFGMIPVKPKAVEPETMDGKQKPWHRWPRGVQWTHPVLNTIRQLKKICTSRPKEPSFRIIRVEKISSVTAPLTACRTRPAVETCLSGSPNFTTAFTGPPPRTQSQQFVPAVFQKRGLIVNDQGELEYRSVYRIEIPGPRRQPHLATTRKDTGFQNQSAPRSHRIDTDTLISVNLHKSSRPSTNIHFLPNAGRNTSPGVACGRPAPRFANTASAGTPLGEHLMSKPVTLPKPANGSPSSELDVGEWRGRRQPRAVIAERQPIAPCNLTLPLTVVTPVSSASSKLTSIDDRRSLPSQLPREAVVLSKIVSPQMRPEVARREPQPVPRPQVKLRRRHGRQSLREIALAEGEKTRDTWLSTWKRW